MEQKICYAVYVDSMNDGFRKGYYRKGETNYHLADKAVCIDKLTKEQFLMIRKTVKERRDATLDILGGQVELVTQDTILKMDQPRRVAFELLLKSTAPLPKELQYCVDFADGLRNGGTLDRTATNTADVKDEKLGNPEKKPRRKRAEIKLLIESAVFTHGDEKPDKFYAEQAGIAPSKIAIEPYSTYLEEAKKEYRKQKAFEKQNKASYKDSY